MHHTPDNQREFLVKLYCRMVLSGSIYVPEFTRTIREIEDATTVELEQMYMEWQDI